MEIKWRQKDVIKLIEIVSYLKKNKIGELLEPLGNFFIEKHLKYINIENYGMNFSSDYSLIDISNISDGEYKLAFICEIINLYGETPQKFKNVYDNFAYMIRYCIQHNVKYFSTEQKITYDTFYLTNLLREVFIPNVKIIKDNPYFNILNFTLFLISEIIKIENNNPDIIYSLTSLISETEFLDLTIFSNQIKREILQILKTKRTLYIRCLLVLTNEIINITNILNPEWLMEKIKFSSQEEFISIISSPIVETIIFLTSFRIKNI